MKSPPSKMIGMMEQWNIGIMGKDREKTSIFSCFENHYSIIPVFQVFHFCILHVDPAIHI